IPMDAPAQMPECDVELDLTASVRFTALPGGRIVRHDHVNVATLTMICEGCAGGPTNPIFTTYVSLDGPLDQYQEDRAPVEAFPNVMDGPSVMSPANDYKLCVSESGGDRKLGINWRSVNGDYAGFRLKSTDVDSASLVFDWRRSAPVEDGDYDAITTMI